jgi:lysophospholipase L1-like esterase
MNDSPVAPAGQNKVRGASGAATGKTRRRRAWGIFAAASTLLVSLLVSLPGPFRTKVYLHLTGRRGQLATARIERALLAGFYRFHEVDSAMVWNNGHRIDREHETIDFLGSIVVRTDSPSLLLFARFDEFGPQNPPRFEISIDGNGSKPVLWRSVLMPQRLDLGTAAEHTVVIRANLLRYNQIAAPFPPYQNAITEVAVPRGFRISARPEPARRHILVTVTDSIGQGYGTPDPPVDAWTARLADSGRWPGNVMNRGFGGFRLTELCYDSASCKNFADDLDRDYPKAAAYYFAVGTNDYVNQSGCVSPGFFAERFSEMLEELHSRNPQASLYLQTPLHRTDEEHPNSCGNTLAQFREKEQLIAQSLPWVTLIDGFSSPFPQNTSDRLIFFDGLHLTARGQDQYFHSVIQALHL